MTHIIASRGVILGHKCKTEIEFGGEAYSAPSVEDLIAITRRKAGCPTCVHNYSQNESDVDCASKDGWQPIYGASVVSCVNWIARPEKNQGVK